MSRKRFNPERSPGFEKFLDAAAAALPANQAPTLLLSPAAEGISTPVGAGACLVCNETWELWSGQANRFMFNFKQYNRSYLSVDVDSAFEAGQLYFSPEAASAADLCLMDVLDLRLYLNWLANFGDLVLHASGFAYDGRGYCFLGESGRGKSTLVRTLAGTPGLTVLGEDQVILRYLDGRFWIFGTPWHTDPSMCSPMGVPLQTMFFLDRSGVESLEPMSHTMAALRLLQTAFVPYYRRECLPLILDRVALLTQSLRCLGLAFRLERDGLDTLLNA